MAVTVLSNSVRQHNSSVKENRRSGFDRLNTKPLSMEEILCARIVGMGGGIFQGIQKAVPEVGLRALALFACPAGSTLAVPVAELTAERVRYEIHRSGLRFAGFLEGELADADRFHTLIDLKGKS